MKSLRSIVVVAGSLALGAGVLYACDTGNPASPVTLGGGDGGNFVTTGGGDGAVGPGVTDGSADAAGDATSEGGGGPVNGCSTFTDNTANANTVIHWNFNVTSDPNHCSMVKAGHTVTWLANMSGQDFSTHPLGPSGGDPGNPIIGTDVDAGEIDASDPAAPTVTIEFDGDGGTYGYHCEVHSTMVGAIKVVP